MAILKQGLMLQSNLELISLIGSGGQAPIWRIREHGQAKRELAAKLVEVPYSKERQDIDTMEREINALSLLHATNIVEILFPISDIHEDADAGRILVLGYAMHLYKEGDFSNPDIVRQLRTNRSALIDALNGVVMAVQMIHGRDIVHYDLKPANVLVHHEANKLVPKLSDFGASYLITEPMTGLGTLPYMAPERFEATFRGSEAGKRSDIYSLGLLMYEMITGRYAFEAATENYDRSDRVLFKHVHQQKEPAWDVIPHEMKKLTELLMAMTRKDPSARPPIEWVYSKFSEIRAELGRDSTTAVRRHVASLSENSYLWNPRVHELLGFKRYYYFLRVKRFLPALDEIRALVEQHTETSIGLFTVFGDVDVIISAWERPENRVVQDVLSRLLRGEFQPHNQSVYEADEYLVPSPQAAQKLSADDVKKWMSDFISAEEAVRDRLMADRRIVLRKLRYSKNDIAMFVRLRWAKKLEHGVQNSYARLLMDVFRRSNFKDYSLAVDHDGYTFILQIRVDRYDKCGAAVHMIHTALEKDRIPEFENFESDTFLDTLHHNRIVTEDGDIIHSISKEMQIRSPGGYL